MRITIKLHFENLSIFFKKSKRTRILGLPLPLLVFVRFLIIILWQHCRDEPALAADNTITDFTEVNAITNSGQ